MNQLVYKTPGVGLFIDQVVLNIFRVVITFQIS